jgi:two-component system invasion response regulator UvrY
MSDSIINSLPGIFLLREYQGRNLRWNKQFEEISGYGPEEIPDLDVYLFYEEDEQVNVKQRVQNMLATGKSSAEVRVVTKAGDRIPFLLTAIVLQLEGKTCIMVMGFDISERKKAEEELNLANEQLRHLSAHLQNIREEERKGIALEIHDELGQQLTALKMDLAWMIKKSKQEPPLLDRLSGMDTLIDHTIDTVRRISSELRPSILDDLGLADALDWQSTEFGKRFLIDLQQVLLSGPRSRDRRRDSHRLVPHLPGIANQYRSACRCQQRIRQSAAGKRRFGPGSNGRRQGIRSPGRRKKRDLRAPGDKGKNGHDGRKILGLEQPGQWDHHYRVRSFERQSLKSSRPMMQILIADDHAVVRRGLSQILLEEFPSAKIEEVDNSEDLIRKAMDGHWDVIISDLSMPGRSGLDALHQLKELLPDTPVLIMSIHPEDHYAIRALKAGASGYLTKATAPTELVKAVRLVLEGRRYISASTAEKLASAVIQEKDKPLHEYLSNREFDVLKLLAAGRPVSEIASQLSLSITTISTYRARIMSKMKIKTNAELTIYAMNNHLL